MKSRKRHQCRAIVVFKRETRFRKYGKSVLKKKNTRTMRTHLGETDTEQEQAKGLDKRRGMKGNKIVVRS